MIAFVRKSRTRTISGRIQIILAIFELFVHWQTQEIAEAFRSRKFGVFAFANAGLLKTVISCDFCKGYIEENRSEEVSGPPGAASPRLRFSRLPFDCSAAREKKIARNAEKPWL